MSFRTYFLQTVNAIANCKNAPKSDTYINYRYLFYACSVYKFHFAMKQLLMRKSIAKLGLEDTYHLICFIYNCINKSFHFKLQKNFFEILEKKSFCHLLWYSLNILCSPAKKPGLPSWMKKSKAAKEAEKEKKATPSPEFFSNDGSFMDRFLAMQGKN